jgi:hypothetical protein
MNERANRIANGFDPRWPKAEDGTPIPLRPDPSLTERDPNRRRRLRDLFA